MADNLNAVPYVGCSYGQPSTAVRNGISDTNYTATSTDTLIAYVTLTAARTVTLPAASSVPAGKQFIIKDESGNCSSGNTITIVGIIDGVSNQTTPVIVVPANRTAAMREETFKILAPEFGDLNGPNRVNSCSLCFN